MGAGSVELAQQVVNGLTLGSIYALVAIGYTLIFGVLRLVFFAQGDLSMVSAFVMLFAVNALSGLGASPAWAISLGLLAAAVATALVAMGAEWIALRPLRQAPRTKQLISTLGVMLVLQNTVYFAVSSESLAFPVQLPDTAWSVRGVSLAPVNVVVVGTALLLVTCTHALIERTRIGLKIRAVFDNPVAAARLGIGYTRVVRVTFALAGILASAAGIMLALYDGVIRFEMGFLPGIKGFTAAVLGGLGSIPGAMVGGVVIGLIEALGAGYVSSDYRHVFVYVVLILVLLFRSQGLLRSPRERLAS